MAMDRKARSGLGDRLFAWYWRRRAARAASKAAAHRTIMRRRQVLDDLARRLEADIAPARGPLADPGAVWTHRPSIFAAAAPAATFGRPDAGAALCDGLTVHHDCPAGNFLVAQRPSRAGDAANRFELLFDSFEFEGAYVSFVLSPLGDLRGPLPRETVGLILRASASRTVKAFIRLNVSGGGGRETFYAEAEIGDGERRFDFDLSFTPFELTGEERLWVDVIIDRPRMLEVAFQDLALTLRPEGAA